MLLQKVVKLVTVEGGGKGGWRFCSSRGVRFYSNH